MPLRVNLHTSYFLLFAFQSLSQIAQHFEKAGYVEICDENHFMNLFHSFYPEFKGECLSLRQK